MTGRLIMLGLAGCLCVTHGEADARTRERAKRLAAMDLTRIVTTPSHAERLRNMRVARWSLGEAAEYDEGRPEGMRWRLRGAGFKMKMPIAFNSWLSGRNN